MTDPAHGDWDDRQVQRWCAECETWVLSIDWMAHYDHGPAETTESESGPESKSESESKSGSEANSGSGSTSGSNSVAESSERTGECPPNP